MGDEQLRGYRRLSLRRAAHQAADWATRQVIEEIDQEGIDRLGELPLKCLSQTQKDDLVAKHILTAVRLDRKQGGRVKQLSALSPKTAARVILRLIAASDTRAGWADESWAVQSALRSLERNEVLAAACEPTFERRSQDELARLIDALMRAQPEPKMTLREEVVVPWRTTLHGWIDLLPPMGQETGHLWSNIALLLGEIGHPEDAHQVLTWLRMDHERVIARQCEWRVRVEAYRASGGKTAPPGPHDVCSYHLIYRQALWNFSGEQVAVQIATLLDDPREMGFAANWLAAYVGAPSSETLGFGHSKYNYELISSRRGRCAEFAASAASTIAALRTVIDRCLADEQLRRTDELWGAFPALARLEGAPSGVWVIERIERYFGDRCSERLFHSMTLVGASFEGQRLLPFVRRTIHNVLNPEYHPTLDQTYRIVEALGALLYSDDPELAVRILENDAVLVFKNKECEIASLLTMARWVVSPRVDEWLKSFFTLDKPERLRSTAFQVAIERAVDRRSYQELRALALEFIGIGDLWQSEGDWTIPGRMGEVLSEHPELRANIIGDAMGATTIAEARRWLRLLAGFETEQSVLIAFQLTERWGESQLGVVSSIFPSRQDRSSLQFSGWVAHWRRHFYRSPAVLARLNEMTRASDAVRRIAAKKALFWLERERLNGRL
jgi:hypothetical protein